MLAMLYVNYYVIIAVCVLVLCSVHLQKFHHWLIGKNRKQNISSRSRELDKMLQTMETT